MPALADSPCPDLRGPQGPMLHIGPPDPPCPQPEPAPSRACHAALSPRGSCPWPVRRNGRSACNSSSRPERSWPSSCGASWPRPRWGRCSTPPWPTSPAISAGSTCGWCWAWWWWRWHWPSAATVISSSGRKTTSRSSRWVPGLPCCLPPAWASAWCSGEWPSRSRTTWPPRRASPPAHPRRPTPPCATASSTGGCTPGRSTAWSRWPLPSSSSAGAEQRW